MVNYSDVNGCIIRVTQTALNLQYQLIIYLKSRQEWKRLQIEASQLLILGFYRKILYSKVFLKFRMYCHASDSNSFKRYELFL